jgi:hypothetical protein
MPNRSGHLSLHARDPGLPAGPPTPTNEAQTTDLAGNALATIPAANSCESDAARVTLAQCRTPDGGGFPAAALACIALACVLLAAGVWTLAGREIRRWAEGQGWEWRSVTREPGTHGSFAREQRRRRQVGMALIALALLLAIFTVVES